MRNSSLFKKSAMTAALALQMTGLSALADHHQPLPPPPVSVDDHRAEHGRVRAKRRVRVRDHRTHSGEGAAFVGIGTRVYNTQSQAFATIVAVQHSGKFVIRFESGYSSGLTSSGWTLKQLALLQGCASEELCVGDEVYNTQSQAFAEIIGIQHNGKVVIKFKSGYSKGLISSGWTRSGLAVLFGCSENQVFCVGDEAFATQSSALVQVVAIQANGKLVVKFEEGYSKGLLSAGWSESSLAYTGHRGRSGHGHGHGQGHVVRDHRDETAVCTTRSNGKTFRASAPSFGQARTQVIRACQRNPHTDKGECQQQSVCQ